MSVAKSTNPNPETADKGFMEHSPNPNRAERQRQFALKNQRRREVRKMGREVVPASRQMVQLLAQGSLRKAKKIEVMSNV